MLSEFRSIVAISRKEELKEDSKEVKIGQRGIYGKKTMSNGYFILH